MKFLTFNFKKTINALAICIKDKRDVKITNFIKFNFSQNINIKRKHEIAKPCLTMPSVKL